jgi:hypothetical protein
MSNSNRHFGKWALVQVCVWIVGCILWFYFRTSYILTHPTDPEEYVYTWSFQAFVFFVFRLIPAFFGLCVLLALEHFALRLFLPKKGLDDKSSA